MSGWAQQRTDGSRAGSTTPANCAGARLTALDDGESSPALHSTSPPPCPPEPVSSAPLLGTPTTEEEEDVAVQTVEPAASATHRAARISPRPAPARRVLRRRYAAKVHAYAVPSLSYYAATATTADGASFSSADQLGQRASGEGPSVKRAEDAPGPIAGLRQRKTSAGANSHRHSSWRGRRPPRRLAGRVLEQQRYSLPPCPPYRIPLYDQACFKYLFPSLFANARRKRKLEVLQLFFLCQMFILAIVNFFMTVVNVFFSSPQPEVLSWVRVLSKVIFILEFVVVVALLAFAVFVVLHAVVLNRRQGTRFRRGVAEMGHAHGATPARVGTHGMHARAQQQQPLPSSAAPHSLAVSSTELAQDTAALVTLAGTFSVLRILGLASPSFAFRRILPVIQNALTMGDVLKGIAFLLMWAAACVLAFLVVIAKTSQIDFTLTKSISAWGLVEYIQLIGLLFNLARVDDSYYKETSVLLDAVHQHYSPPGKVRAYVAPPSSLASFLTATPTRTADAGERNASTLDSAGEPTEAAAAAAAAAGEHAYVRRLQSVFHRTGSSEGGESHSALLTRVLDALRIPPFMYFKYFDVIYDYHFNAYPDKPKKEKGEEKEKGSRAAREGPDADGRLSTRAHVFSFFNYLAFIFEIDNVQLRRYLQMVHSPLPFYRLGRDAFAAAFVEKDIVGMDTALWRSDPTLKATQRYALACPNQFNIAYTTEDRRDVWDPHYTDWAARWEQAKAARMAKNVSAQASGTFE